MPCRLPATAQEARQGSSGRPQLAVRRDQRLQSDMLALILMAAISASPKAGPAKDDTALILNIKPAQVVVYLDGKKLGTADKVNTVKVKPGEHTIKLVLKKDSSEDVVTVKKGQKKIWEFDMTDSGDPSQKPKPEGAQPEPAVP